MNSQADEPQIRHSLTILRRADELSTNMAATCRHYGISRATFYKRERCFKAEDYDVFKAGITLAPPKLAH